MADTLCWYMVVARSCIVCWYAPSLGIHLKMLVRAQYEWQEWVVDTRGPKNTRLHKNTGAHLARMDSEHSDSGCTHGRQVRPEICCGCVPVCQPPLGHYRLRRWWTQRPARHRHLINIKKLVPRIPQTHGEQRTCIGHESREDWDGSSSTRLCLRICRMHRQPQSHSNTMDAPTSSAYASRCCTASASCITALLHLWMFGCWRPMCALRVPRSHRAVPA